MSRLSQTTLACLRILWVVYVVWCSGTAKSMSSWTQERCLDDLRSKISTDGSVVHKESFMASWYISKILGWKCIIHILILSLIVHAWTLFASVVDPYSPQSNPHAARRRCNQFHRILHLQSQASPNPSVPSLWWTIKELLTWCVPNAQRPRAAKQVIHQPPGWAQANQSLHMFHVRQGNNIIFQTIRIPLCLASKHNGISTISSSASSKTKVSKHGSGASNPARVKRENHKNIPTHTHPTKHKE